MAHGLEDEEEPGLVCSPALLPPLWCAAYAVSAAQLWGGGSGGWRELGQESPFCDMICK